MIRGKRQPAGSNFPARLRAQYADAITLSMPTQHLYQPAESEASNDVGQDPQRSRERVSA